MIVIIVSIISVNCVIVISWIVMTMSMIIDISDIDLYILSEKYECIIRISIQLINGRCLEYNPSLIIIIIESTLDLLYSIGFSGG